MNYQVSTVEYTTPASENYSTLEEKHTTTVIKVIGNINLKDIILPMVNLAEVYIENNKNQWLFMSINCEPERNYCSAHCVNSELEVWWYDLIDKRDSEGEEYENGGAEALRQLHYLKAQLN